MVLPRCSIAYIQSMDNADIPAALIFSSAEIALFDVPSTFWYCSTVMDHSIRPNYFPEKLICSY